MKKLFMAKENISKMKREPTIWENIFANDTLDKGFISKIHKNSHNSPPGRQTIQTNPKMENKPDQTLLHGRPTEGPETYERMFSITSHYRDAN